MPNDKVIDGFKNNNVWVNDSDGSINNPMERTNLKNLYKIYT